MASTPDIGGRNLHSAVNDLVVRTMQEYTGRGATRARTVVSPDTIMVLLEDTLTKGEQTLVDHGRVDEVLSIRRAFQQAMEDELTAEIERLTGREVVAFLSANHVRPDYSAEIFVLGDRRTGGSAGPSGAPDDTAPTEA
ncbi:Na-translocating system protein MpsC family protein [Patulibacter sp. S7RM1-6]